jgi:dTDP-4-amino-4,6-dideoxygalactose transaminase
MYRPTSISLSPNTEKDDISLAFRLKFQPWLWKKGKTITELEGEFKKYLGVRYAASFNSGRSALMAILNSLAFEKDSEILLQAFTCNAVANPIIWAGLKPIYVDVNNETFNIDAEDLKKKITPKSRAVIVQHTFGLPAYMDEIFKICEEKNLILIEDCAHSLGANYGVKKVGTLGKVSFFSFSRDKVISSVYGGMAVTNDDELAKKIKEYQEKIGYPSYFWIKQQLLHPVLMNRLILPIYSVLGKYLLILFQWLHILSKAVHWKEKRGLKPCYFPKRLPNALAVLALNQFKKLERFNQHRKEIANFYFQELARKQGSEERSDEGSYYNELKETDFELPVREQQIFLRFTVKHRQAHEIIRMAWQNNILIGDWYTTPIAPYDTKIDKIQYVSGSCPVAEKLAKETLNLPTHINISKEDAKKIVEFLKQWR